MSKPDLDLEDLLVPGGFGFDDAPGELLVPSSGPELAMRKKAALGLSQHHAERLVGYGFYAPDGDARGHWTVAPEDCFRATKIYAWSAAQGAHIESMCFGNDDEQVIGGHSWPAELFACWASPEQFLALYAGLGSATPGPHRVLFKRLPAQLNFDVPLDLPTLSIGQSLSVRWSGALTGLFICGRELVPQPREEGQPGQPGGQEKFSEPPIPPSSPPGCPGLPGCPSSLPAATKDPTP